MSHEREKFLTHTPDFCKRILFGAPTSEQPKLLADARARAAELGCSDEFEKRFTEKLRTESKLNHLLMLSPEDNLSEIKAAEVFGKLYRSELRYNVTGKKFYFYNGIFWEPDNGDIHARQLAKEFHRLMMMYAYEHLESDTAIEAFVKFYGRYGRKSFRDTLINDSITELAISENDFDKDLSLLNLANGTYSLIKHTLQEHDPEDLLTNFANVDFVPGAKSELWEKFIDDVFPNDKELQQYVKAALGYALTGVPELERMFIFYGQSTRNGKSTLLNSVANVLGSYAMNTPAETLQLKIRDSRTASEDLARLSKCRLLSVSEPSHSMIFDVPLIKSLTGRDVITARRLYESSFEFIPKFSIFLNTNFLPRVLEESLFSSHRVDVVPFSRHFTESEQDTTLKQKLQTEENKSAILWWIIEGLRDFQLNGLPHSYSVQIATRDYVQRSDKFQNYLDEALEETDTPSLSAKEGYEVYKNWCSESGFAYENKSKFMEKLRQKGLLLTTATIDGKTVYNVISGYKSIK